MPSPALLTPVAWRMNSFRYPDDATPSAYHIYQTTSLPARPRRSGESETSPGYDSDAESFAMESPTMRFQSIPSPQAGLDFTHQHQHQLQRSPSDATERQDSAHTAVSRPTSGGKSSVTAWEQVQSSISPTLFSRTRRRHSDGPFIYNTQGVIVAAIQASDEGHGQSSRGHGEAHSQLHPYVSGLFSFPVSLIKISSGNEFHIANRSTGQHTQSNGRCDAITCLARCESYKHKRQLLVAYFSIVSLTSSPFTSFPTLAVLSLVFAVIYAIPHLA